MCTKAMCGLVAILLILVFFGAMPVFASDEDDEDEREAQRLRNEKRWLEVMARRDQEGYEEWQERMEEEHKPKKQHHRRKTGMNLGILFAPDNRNGEGGFGLEFLWPDDEAVVGATLWMAGDPGFFFTGDTIDTYIPHDDFTRYEDRGGFGLLVEYGFDVGGSYLMLGGGITVESTHYTDVSNVTGWQWEGGSDDHEFIPSAQISLLVPLGGDAGIRAGYDSHYQWFFGILF